MPSRPAKPPQSMVPSHCSNSTPQHSTAQAPHPTRPLTHHGAQVLGHGSDGPRTYPAHLPKRPQASLAEPPRISPTQTSTLLTHDGAQVLGLGGLCGRDVVPPQLQELLEGVDRHARCLGFLHGEGKSSGMSRLADRCPSCGNSVKQETATLAALASCVKGCVLNGRGTCSCKIGDSSTQGGQQEQTLLHTQSAQAHLGGCRIALAPVHHRLDLLLQLQCVQGGGASASVQCRIGKGTATECSDRSGGTYSATHTPSTTRAEHAKRTHVRQALGQGAKLLG